VNGAHEVPDIVKEAVIAMTAGDAFTAEATLRRIDLASLVRERDAAMAKVWGPTVRRKVPSTVPRARRRGPSESMKLAVFRRDSFTCRYCGRRTIWLPVLRHLSTAFPEVMPYHPNWRPVSSHILYWTYSASFEHHVPLARGGAESDENYVTTCYQCNDIKNYYLVEELGWRLREPGQQWDGIEPVEQA
jgi:5-methylcytosine-specific restriction endonuclease McrA